LEQGAEISGLFDSRRLDPDEIVLDEAAPGLRSIHSSNEAQRDNAREEAKP
jgi:hypothetical protein